MIIFQTIRWKNFLSTGNLFTEINLNKSRTTLVIGENGAGKSTILDALSFGLFNKPFRKINKSLLLNSIIKKDLVVELEFDIGKNSYKIIRGMKPNVFEVYQNGVLLNQAADNRDYQETLERQILKINHKSFCQVVILGSASFVPFMQLATGQRREIIEDLLDLQIFTHMNDILKEKIKFNYNSLKDAQYEVKSSKEKIDLIGGHMREKQQNNEIIINEKKDRIKESAKQYKEEKSKHDELEKEAKELATQTEKIEEVENKLNKLNSLKHKLDAKISSLEGDISFFHDHDNCPTCRQNIDLQFKDVAIDEKSTDLKEVKEGLEKLEEEIKVTTVELNRQNEINKQIRNKIMEMNVISTKMKSIEKYAKELDTEIKTLKKSVTTTDEDKLAEIEEILRSNEKSIVDLTEERTVFAQASVLLKDGGIKSKIIKQYVPIINKLINKYLSAMEFLVQFELDEEFNETIKSRHRDEFSYASFSEGEKMRINLAILFTWRAVAKLRNSISTNILIMDEVFDSSLDSNGSEEFMKILNNLTSDTNTFIISHKTDQIGDKFENVIKFEKNRNFSRIAA